ncbi:MAG: hypothetical protein M1827_001634 [Pycnora praestabilis]|nr:MAG: hypothetical protein M1827_001634 [Pycnora praestabilis]
MPQDLGSSPAPKDLPRHGQDMPPSGGYEPVQYKRNLPARGFRPAYYLLAVGAIMTYGFIKVGKGIREQNELAREKMWSRIHLIPLLQAEEDRDLVRRHYAEKARERQLLGSETEVYNSDRCVRSLAVRTYIWNGMIQCWDFHGAASRIQAGINREKGKMD